MDYAALQGKCPLWAVCLCTGYALNLFYRAKL